jgi:phosphatidylserine/phosphatidylglycerophosphate/cardiolipin synthase-like enzyme
MRTPFVFLAGLVVGAVLCAVALSLAFVFLEGTPFHHQAQVLSSQPPPTAPAPTPPVTDDKVLPPITVHFSPKGGCTQEVVSVIDAAKTEILVMAYSFTSEPILAALKRAIRRKVHVQAVVDAGSNKNTQRSVADDLAAAGAEVYLDSRHAIFHDKVMIIDSVVVVTGSFNFTNAAEINNAENLLVIHSSGLAARYAENWETHRQHSQLIKEEIPAGK